jgi:hypothetical protein
MELNPVFPEDNLQRKRRRMLSNHPLQKSRTVGVEGTIKDVQCSCLRSWN